MFARLPIVVSLALLAASPAASAWNLLKNPDFYAGTSGWNVSQSGGATAGWESYLSAPATGIGGSLRLDANPGTAHADQCVDVSKWFDIDVAVTKFNNATGGGGTATFKLDVYDQSACGGMILSTITLPDAGVTVIGNQGASWTQVSTLGTPLPSGALSAKINLDTSAPPGGIAYYLIDHVQVVPPDEIFPNAFEAP